MGWRAWWRALCGYWWLVVLATVSGAALGVIVNIASPSTFTATSSVLVEIKVAGTPSDWILANSYLDSQIPTYAQLAVSGEALNRAVDRTGIRVGPEELGSSTRVIHPAGTRVLRIAVDNRDPGAAAVLANALADELERSVSQQAPADPSGRAAVAISITRATTPSQPSGPKPVRNVALLAATGLTLGAAWAIWRDARARSSVSR